MSRMDEEQAVKYNPLSASVALMLPSQLIC